MAIDTKKYAKIEETLTEHENSENFIPFSVVICRETMNNLWNDEKPIAPDTSQPNWIRRWFGTNAGLWKESDFIHRHDRESLPPPNKKNEKKQK